MAIKRKKHTPAFKAQVALAAIQGERTANELASHFSVHPILVHSWKKQLLQGAEEIFSNNPQAPASENQPDSAELFEQIGRLKMELEWLKKSRTSHLKRKDVS